MAKRGTNGDAPDAKRQAVELACLGGSLMPELGKPKKGKVRDIYFTGDHVLMVATDRVSAFDHTIPNLIPHKGVLLNRIAEFNFRKTEDIIPNALVDSPDPNVVIQRKLKNLGVECIVRGYVWGSMAGAYEKGERSLCGLKLPDGLLRYQKLDEPLFTPTTKAEEGPDMPMTFDEVAKQVGGKDRAEKIKQVSLALYQRGNELASKAGLTLVDTKYEFGEDAEGKIYLIDEVNTPDSSRLVKTSEWEKLFPQIKAEMAGGAFKHVNAMLEKKPELKPKEYSKQYVRDVLIEKGFKPGKEVPQLTPAQVEECTKRYIEVCEMLTGEKFAPPPTTVSAPQRLVANLKNAGYIKGCCALIFAGSDSDLGHMEKIQKNLDSWGVPSKKRICSAHKQPSKLQQTLEMFNESIEPCVIIGCAGGTDALSGTASFLSRWPVVSVPPDAGGENESCLRNPPGSSNAYCRRPDNAARFVAQLFSCHNDGIAAKLMEKMNDKIDSLAKADGKQW